MRVMPPGAVVVPERGENLLDENRVFDCRDDSHSPAAVLTNLDVDVEHPLETLRPAHGGAAFGARVVIGLVRCLAARATLGRRDVCAVSAVGGEHPVVADQVRARGGGTSAARRARKSSGSNTTWVVPSL